MPYSPPVVGPPCRRYIHSARQHSAHRISLPKFSSVGIQFSSDLWYLEKVDLCVYSTDKWSGCKIAALLRQIHNVKFLTLNLEFVEPLISYMEQISLQCSPFSELKSLKIYPVYVRSDDEAHKKVNMSTKVINYMLDGSPSATFTLISYEEVKEKQQKAHALANAVEAQNLMARLHVTLEKEKTNIENNRTRMESLEEDTHEQGMAPVEKMQLHF
ncbi:hypothetical protein L1987_50690 [Smallanthus sonchifolius]|uniref:Uncharacterized protein n=1 Tax=Smallanthus sonchifolius TaxID=185202 RepID=A0ACB9EN66_9ASTR|nr:hypothetical protein L1987_50690 [Smallanthus sonchifolius]